MVVIKSGHQQVSNNIAEAIDAPTTLITEAIVSSKQKGQVKRNIFNDENKNEFNEKRNANHGSQ